MTSNVYGTLLLPIKHFCVTEYICLNGLLSWIIIIIIIIWYIFMVLFLYINLSLIFFFLYIFVLLFLLQGYIYIYIYIETYCHIVMVINSKLLIWSWHLWKIYQIKSNQTTLYTLNRTCDRKIKVQYSESFGQTAWQSVMLKMTQNHAKVHCEHSQSSLSSMNK